MKLPLTSLTLLNTNYQASSSCSSSPFFSHFFLFPVCIPSVLPLLLSSLSKFSHQLPPCFFPLTTLFHRGTTKTTDWCFTNKFYQSVYPFSLPLHIDYYVFLKDFFFICCEIVCWEFFFVCVHIWCFWWNASDKSDIFRTLVGKWPLVEYSQQLSRWQTGRRM